MVRSIRTSSVKVKLGGRVPLELPQCRTAPLHCLLVGCDSSTSSPAPKRQLCRGVGWGVEGSRLEAWMKSHKSEVAII